MSDERPPPLGSWARTYTLVILLALLTFLLLHWVTATWQIRLPR